MTTKSIAEIGFPLISKANQVIRLSSTPEVVGCGTGKAYQLEYTSLTLSTFEALEFKGERKFCKRC
jgi:hypothetical protein